MIKKVLLFVVIVALACYFLAAITVLNKPKEGQVCEQVEIIIEDSVEHCLINENDIQNYLVRKKIFPKGKQLQDIDLIQLEETLKKSPYIDQATCYKTATGSICIKVKSKQVILHIISENGEDYYLDHQGNTVPKASYFANMPIVTGNINKQYARQKLTTLGKIIQNDPFWNQQVEQIHVQANGKLEIIPRVGKHTILLGEPKDFKKKLEKLKVFYEKGISQVGWNKYSEISLEYNDQIICTKNKD